MLQTWRREENGKAEQLVAALQQMAREELVLIVRPMKDAEVAPPAANDILTGNVRMKDAGSGRTPGLSTVPRLPIIASG